MLFVLGNLTVEVYPFNVHSVDESADADFAVKAVVGVEPPLEFVGEGGNELTLSGRLFPAALGGMDELALLDQMRASGKPQYLMRGDGTPLGWYAILNKSTQSSYLDRQGVGKRIDVSIRLRRAAPPSDNLFYSLIARLF